MGTSLGKFEISAIQKKEIDALSISTKSDESETTGPRDTLYKGLFKPHLDFAGIVFSRISKKMVAKLESAQLIALKLCAGFMRSTPSNVVLAETGEMPIGMRRE